MQLPERKTMQVGLIVVLLLSLLEFSLKRYIMSNESCDCDYESLMSSV